MPSSDVRAPRTSLLTRTTTIDSLASLRTDANAWALDPVHLDETRAALRTIVDPTNPGIFPVLALECESPLGVARPGVLRLIDDEPQRAYGDLTQVRLGTVPSTLSARLDLGSPGLLRAVLEPGVDGVVVFANDAAVVAIAGRRASRLPAGLRHLEASRVPVSRLTRLLAGAGESLLGLDLGASKSLIKTPDLTFLAAAPRLRRLDLRYVDTLSDLAPLAACPELDTLLLFNCRSVVDLTPLAALGALHALRLDNCSGVADLSPLGGLHKLREVGLHRCTAVNPASEALEELLTRPGLVVSW